MIAVALDRPWLVATLDRPMRLVSWAPWGGGIAQGTRVYWREVRDDDLTEAFDAIGWLATEMAARGAAGEVAMMTSRNLGRYRLETAGSGQTRAACLATVGLGNAERVGQRQARTAPVGTINLLAATDAALSLAGALEALSIAVAARTAAVLEHGPDLPGGRATGTGTDCIVLASPDGAEAFAGLHTAVGEALGRAVYDAVAGGVREWIETGGAE